MGSCLPCLTGMGPGGSMALDPGDDGCGPFLTPKVGCGMTPGLGRCVGPDLFRQLLRQDIMM